MTLLQISKTCKKIVSAEHKQWTVDSEQWTTVNYQLSTVNYKRIEIRDC